MSMTIDVVVSVAHSEDKATIPILDGSLKAGL
jgi:hypothetical protein